MIRIDLVDTTNNIKHIDFNVVPVTEEKDFTCIPLDILPLRSVVRISRQLKAGRVAGDIGKFVWYRLIQGTHDTHKKSLDNQIEPNCCQSTDELPLCESGPDI